MIKLCKKNQTKTDAMYKLVEIYYHPCINVALFELHFCLAIGPMEINGKRFNCRGYKKFYLSFQKFLHRFNFSRFRKCKKMLASHHVDVSKNVGQIMYLSVLSIFVLEM